MVATTSTLTSTSTRTITSRMYDYSSSRLKMQHDAPDKTTLLPGAFNCTTTWFDQPLDHFNFRDAKQTYKQRVLIYDKFWSRNALDGSRGPIFFYCGNEGDVTLYANNTGLMWENAEQFGAALIFAEHRYYGQSHPFEQNNSREHMQYLTHEQALADYANLIYTFKQNNSAASSRVIAFGGTLRPSNAHVRAHSHRHPPTHTHRKLRRHAGCLDSDKVPFRCTRLDCCVGSDFSISSSRPCSIVSGHVVLEGCDTQRQVRSRKCLALRNQRSSLMAHHRTVRANRNRSD